MFVHYEGIDILINNASAIQLTGTLETSLKRYDLMHQVNVRGAFVCSHHMLLQVDSIAYDEQGLYLLSSAIQLPDYKSWICERCYKPNWTWRTKCYACGANVPNYNENN